MRYAMMSANFWTRGSGKRLRGDPEAQVVAAYLVTSPSSNMLGLYYLPVSSIAHDTGLAVPKVRAALKRIEAAGFALYDELDEVVFVPNLAKFDVGEALSAKDKRRGKILALFRQFSDHRFASRLWDVYGVAYELPAPSVRPASVAPKALPEGASANDACPIDGASAQPDAPGTARHGTDRIGTERTRARGTTLPTDWRPDDELRAWARRKGVAERDIEAAAERFTNHWWAADPAKNRNAVKSNWSAAFRTWVLRDIDDGKIRALVLAPRPPPAPEKTPEQIDMLERKSAVLAAASAAMRGDG